MPGIFVQKRPKSVDYAGKTLIYAVRKQAL
jgi:hypothetical protein